MERKLVTVAVDGSAEFTTLTAAAAAQDPRPAASLCAGGRDLL